MTTLALVATLTLSAVLTRALIGYALARGVLDVPNNRSSHTSPTPRGGGLAIVVTFLASVCALMTLHAVPTALGKALLVSGLITAGVGFWDDHVPLSARFRLTAHVIAAIAALALLGGMPAIALPGIGAPPYWLMQVLGLLILVWLLNLYNFMDGIDGIAGVQAVTVCVGASAVAAVNGYWPGSLVCLMLAAATAGFLVWNIPPARIFMGDVGSGFLGIVLGILAIDAGGQAHVLFWSWMILLGLFVVDATVTLLRRFLRGERVSQPHRSHAYQHAARAFGSHRPVTLAFGIINLAWLLPWALLVATERVDGPIGLAFAWLPLIVLALRWRAGCVDDSRY